MATPRWTPRALPVAQVDSITIANTWTAADTLTVTINQRSLVLTVGATVTTASIAQAVVEMINGEDATGNATRNQTGDNVPEFAEVEASLFSASVVHVTGRTAGVPFTMTVTESTVGTGTATRAAVTAATGPNHYDNAANWSGGALPADGDSVYVDNSDVSILYGLLASDIEPAAVYIALSFTGDIGLPEINEGGQYQEYRPQYLLWGPAVLQVGAGPGSGSGRIKIDSGTDQCALTVIDTGAPTDEALPALIWKGTHASNSLVMRAGSAGVAVFGGETAALATFRVDGGSLRLGAGTTLSGALVVNDGDVEINSLVDTSLTVLGGTVAIDGTGNVDQLTIRGGTVVYNTTGTLGGNTLLSGAAVLDFERDPSAKTVTNAIDLYGPDCFVFDQDKVVATLVVDLNEGATASQVRWGSNVRLTRGTPA